RFLLGRIVVERSALAGGIRLALEGAAARRRSALELGRVVLLTRARIGARFLRQHELRHRHAPGILDAPRAARGRLLRALRRRGTRASGRGGARRRRWLVALGLRPRLQLGEAEHVLQALPVSILLPALRLPALRRRFRGTLGVHRRKNVLERILLLTVRS